MDTHIKRIETRLVELGLSRNEAERRVGLKKNYLRDILDRERKPGLDKIALICKALEATPDELFPEIESLYSQRQIRYIRETNKAERKIMNLEAELDDQLDIRMTATRHN